MKLKLLLFVFFVSMGSVKGHSGRTNQDGCHNDRVHGGYHCHRTAAKSKRRTSPTRTLPQYVTLYERSTWPHWIDQDHDCQNTRAEILIANSQTPVKFRSWKHCTVDSGKWYDPYSGKFWYRASDLDIDHMVPLAWAHGHGAGRWTTEQKQQFANDLENLLAVRNVLNRQKSAKSPDDWMPPNQRYRCRYVAHFNKIVVKYRLIYAASEKRIIDRMLVRCQKH